MSEADLSLAPATRVAVLGAGSWGTTFAKVLADAGAEVNVWARRPEVAREISESHRNSDYLRGINLPHRVWSSTQLHEVLDGAEQVYLAVPSQALREHLRIVRELIPAGVPVVSLMKGIEAGTAVRMTEVVEQELGAGPERIAVVSGPNLALEIAKEQPTAAVVASSSEATASRVAMTVTTGYFHAFINTDVVGTEFGGVLKNLIAVATGIVDGVGHGENTKASIITRGLAEMTEFAVAFGARPETLSGLAGLGDLIATCESPLSRNNTAGRLLGQGLSLAEVVKQMRQTAEGLASVAPVLQLAASRGVRMPIVEQLGEVLAGTLDPRELAPHLTTESELPRGE